ncbi:MAG: LLM class flavin-dependent oxidoreductase [Acidimicrobiia bacterium]|nr:LLM class flavin-dependent oxidoreductase [Acidimicrobiia bacterium]
MQVGVFLFGAVPMPDAGAGDPQPTDRRASKEAVWHTTERLVDVGVLADQLGYDYFFLTEHHFQHEGYEVVPNALMTGLVVAERTDRIKIGALVHVLPQWHPLRFAEDFATLHNFSRGRAVLALGRGTVPREAIPLGTVIGSTDDPAKRAEQDAVNRAKFAEAVEIVSRALNAERFSFHGDHYDVPPPGIPDRGRITEELTLLPRPLYPYEEWQTVSSRETLEAVARRGVGAVWWNLAPDLLQEDWDRFAEVWEDEHGTALAPGERRMVVLNARVGDNTADAMARARPGWDEHWKFLGPYGRLDGFRRTDGSPLSPGEVPTLEDGMAQGLAIVGTAAEVAEQIAARLEPLSADSFTIYPLCLGDPYDVYEDQLTRIAADVLPKLR